MTQTTPHIQDVFLTDENVAAIEKLGWKFLPNGPDEWDWMKFDPVTGYRTNIQGDQAWEDAVRYVKGI